MKSKTKTRNGNLEGQLGNTCTQIKDIQNDLSTKRQSLLAAQQVHLLIFAYWEPAESIICVWFSSFGILLSRCIRSNFKQLAQELQLRVDYRTGLIKRHHKQKKEPDKVAIGRDEGIRREMSRILIRNSEEWKQKPSCGTRPQGSSRAYCGTAINCLLPFLHGIRYWKSLHNNTCQLLRYPPSYPPPSLFFKIVYRAVSCRAVCVALLLCICLCFVRIAGPGPALRALAPHRCWVAENSRRIAILLWREVLHDFAILLDSNSGYMWIDTYCYESSATIYTIYDTEYTNHFSLCIMAARHAS